MSSPKRTAPQTPEERIYLYLQGFYGRSTPRTVDRRRVRELLNTPSEDEKRAAGEEWPRMLAGGAVSEGDRERWIQARAVELRCNKLLQSLEESLAHSRAAARRDPAYALLNPVYEAAREETLEPTLSHWHQQAARRYLDARKKKDELARRALDDTSIVDRLARLVQEHAAQAWLIVLDVDSPPPLAPARRAIQPMPWRELHYKATRAVETDSGPAHWADTEFAELLRKIGPTGEEAANAVLRKSAERIALPLRESDPFPWLGAREQRDEWWDRAAKEGATEQVRQAELGTASWEFWLHEDSHPRIYDYLAWALWEDVLRPQFEREERLLAPALPVWLARTIVAAPRAKSITTERGAVVLTDGDWRYTAPPAALADVARGALSEDARRAAATLAAYLALAAWRQLRAGVERWDYVPIPAARNALRAVFGADLEERELDAALEWLSGFCVHGWPCVAGVHAEKTQPPGGGRPAKGRVVHVGLPLAPHSIENVYIQAGVTLPGELRWYSPVLPPANAPLVGDHRTRERQRAAFALGLGAVLIDRREEYADRGGVRLNDLRRPLMKLGIYYRSHKSLVDDLLGAWLREPKSPLLPEMPTAPVLVETTPGAGIYRLGPDYPDAERMILDAAGLSAAGRSRTGRGRKPRKSQRS